MRGAMDLLHQLFGKQANALLSNANSMHKVAAVRSREEGLAVSDDFNLHDAVHVMGAKMHTKRAEHRSVIDGVVALHGLQNRSW